MRRKPVSIYLLFLMLSTFACSQFSSSEVPTPTATVFATPTLAPTSTADPNVQLPPTVVGQDVSQVPLITLTPFQAPVLPTRLGTGGTTGGGSGSSGGGNGSSGGGSSGGAGGTTTAACPAGGQNLLINPGFEGEFKPFGAIG